MGRRPRCRPTIGPTGRRGIGGRAVRRGLGGLGGARPVDTQPGRPIRPSRGSETPSERREPPAQPGRLGGGRRERRAKGERQAAIPGDRRVRLAGARLLYGDHRAEAGFMAASLVRRREPGLRFARAGEREDLVPPGRPFEASAPSGLPPSLAARRGRNTDRLADSGGSRGRPAGRQDVRSGHFDQVVLATRRHTVNPAPEIRERGRARTPGNGCAGSCRRPTPPASPPPGRRSIQAPVRPSGPASAARRAGRPRRWRRRWRRCRR